MADDEVAQEAWPQITEIFELYYILLDTLTEIKKMKDNQKLLQRWKEHFLAVNTADPHPPYDLLDADWPAEEYEKEFIKLGTAGLFKLLIRKIS